MFNVYDKIMGQLNLKVLQTKIPDTNRYEKEMTLAGKHFFRCTLFPPSEKMMKGSNMVNLSEEIFDIISNQTIKK
jgi:hypothetical protein